MLFYLLPLVFLFSRLFVELELLVGVELPELPPVPVVPLVLDDLPLLARELLPVVGAEPFFPLLSEELLGWEEPCVLAEFPDVPLFWLGELAPLGAEVAEFAEPEPVLPDPAWTRSDIPSA
jgi:hypothetical protein